MAKFILAASIASLVSMAPSYGDIAEGIFTNVVVGTGDNDANVGLNSLKEYVATSNFAGPALTINNVNFEGGGGANPAGTNYSVSSVGGVFTNFSSGVAGQLGSLLSDFVYGGNPATFTLQNLIVGQTYIFTSYNGVFGGNGGRLTTITSSSGPSTLIDENAGAGLNLLRYTFTATAPSADPAATTTSETLSFLPKSPGDTYHFYGFTNEQVFNNDYVSGTDFTTSTYSKGFSPAGAGLSVNFTDGGASRNINLDQSLTLGHLQFSSTTGYTLSGANTLTLQADVGGISVLSTPVGTHTISSPLLLVNDATKTGAGTIVLDGAVSGSGTLQVTNGTARFTTNDTFSAPLAVQGGGTVDLNGTTQDFTKLTGVGAIQNSGTGTSVLGVNSGSFAGTISDHGTGTGTGLVSVHKTGGDFYSLTGTNSYSGGTVVSGGSLLTTSSAALGSGPVTVEAGAAWQSFGPQTVVGLQGSGTAQRTITATGADGAELISTSKNYLQKLDFGNGSGATVNNVVFDNASSNPSGPGYTFTTATNLFGENNGGLTGYDKLVSDFFYGDGGNQTPSSLTLNNLTTGNAYEIILYTKIGIWGSRPQLATFTSGTQSDQFTLDPVNIGYVQYRFIADGDSATIQMAAQTPNNSFHYFAATLEDLAMTNETNVLTIGDAGSYDFSGNITGVSPLVKQGTGVQTLSGSSSLSGPTTINNGTLLVSGSIANSSVTVASGGTLRGGGVVGDLAISAGGLVNPGNSAGNVGSMTVGSGQGVVGFDLAAGGHLQLELGGVAGGQYDRINVTTASGISLAGDLIGSLINGYQADPSSDLLFIIVNSGTDPVTGGFSNQFAYDGSPTILFGNKAFVVSYDANFVADGDLGNALHGGNDVALMAVAVPEPTSMVSMLGGLGLLVSLRRRSRRSMVA